MPQELQKEIENHLATFPDRHRELEEMRKEWREFNTRATWILVGFLGSLLAIGVWVGTMETKVETMGDSVKDNDKRLNALEVNNGEIKSRLTSIEVTLQEIKTAIIRLQ
jgi:wobble nucleotide-excising tRNase